ncbi:MAG: 16S rRNA (cytosine(967)-C(5))-methyltransferase [Leptolyngbyaceae cyanobacterium RM1_1_2]|nr:16S rRNA (cytosine(967)-C(5))-methyltransferase [Leptolyngbyaceae cyanobacterium RM1_1_2]
MTTSPSRQQAFWALQAVHRGAFTDVAIDQALKQSDLSSSDRALMTELVYGSVRRQRTLDALIDQLGKKSADQQPPELRVILHLGLYQLRYLDQIPASAAVNTSVELAKQQHLGKLAGVVNGLLRQYIRQAEAGDPLRLPANAVQQLGVLHSFPDWILKVWQPLLPLEELAELCDWFNRPPFIDLRINPLRTSLEAVEAAFQTANIELYRLPRLPQTLRLASHVGSIRRLPGYEEGWWTVQDASAQLVSQIVNPQPGEVIIDACAAPGGKSTHLAELMGDRGQIWACDRAASRLKKVQENINRLQLSSIQLLAGDSRSLPQFAQTADRVLLDVPCSGLGTLHRHADARWRQSPQRINELVQLQSQLVNQAATWIKPGGLLVYSTCTLHPLENEAVIQKFLATHPQWQLEVPEQSEIRAIAAAEGWVKIWPHREDMDGFFVAKLRSTSA